MKVIYKRGWAKYLKTLILETYQQIFSINTIKHIFDTYQFTLENLVREIKQKVKSLPLLSIFLRKRYSIFSAFILYLIILSIFILTKLTLQSVLPDLLQHIVLPGFLEMIRLAMLVTLANEIALVIADVTGKAMKGAMNAVMTDGILHMAAEEMVTSSPGDLMMKLNKVLKERTDKLMNVTMIIGMINADTKSLTLANAGHHVLPILFREGKIQQIMVKGVPLGIMADAEYNEKYLQLQSEDVLILMTDGIIETKQDIANYYSDSGRLEKTISQFTQHITAEDMVEAIIVDAIDFGGNKETRDDDMTVVVAKVL